MALFEKQINIIRAQLSGLETSQRVALGLCVLVIGVSVLWLTQWSMQREMVPLHSDTLSESEINDVARQLQMMGERFEEKNGAIYVRPDDRRRLIMALAQRSVGPKKLELTFLDLIDKQDVFASQERARWQQNIALQSELAKVVRTSSQIADANVFIGTPPKSKLGGPVSKPTASIQVSLASGAKIEPMVRGLADLVARAVPDLDPQNITVVDIATLRSYKVDDQEDLFGTQLLDKQRQIEKELATKIGDLLSPIPGALISVSVELDEQMINSVETVLEKPEPRREVSEEKVISGSSKGQEPGAAANTSVALTGGASGSSHEETKRETEYSENRGSKVTTTAKMPGKVLDARASISIPRSYFTGIAKSESKDPGEEPAKEQIDEIQDREIPKIVKAVTPLLMAENKPVVEVTTYSDGALAYVPQVTGSEPQVAQASVGVVDYVNANIKQIGLVVMALLALGFMLHIVRKSPDALAAPPALLREERLPLGPEGELMVDGGPVGKAAAPDAFLIAPEADENSVRARQIAREVSDLVETDTQAAADLVRRWIEKEH